MKAKEKQLSFQFALLVDQWEQENALEIPDEKYKILKADSNVFAESYLKRLETDGLIDLTDRAPGPPIGGYDENSWFIGKPELERRTKNLVTPFGKMFVKFISESELEHGNEKHV